MNAHDFAEMTHHVYGKPSRWWRYSDTFAVASLRDRAGRRLMLPAVKAGNVCYWQRPPEPLPLYAAAAIAARPDAPVMVVEGEPATEAAAVLFPDHVCTTWPGGRQSVGWAGLGPLMGRTIILWPRHDGPGEMAMVRLQERLKGQDRTCRVARIEVPAGWPPAWDMAQPLPPGVTIDTLRGMLRAAIATLLDPSSGGAAPSHVADPVVLSAAKDLAADRPANGVAGDSPAASQLLRTPQGPSRSSGRQKLEPEVPRSVIDTSSSISQPEPSSPEPEQAASDPPQPARAVTEPSAGDDLGHLVPAPGTDPPWEIGPPEAAVPQPSASTESPDGAWPDPVVSVHDISRGDLPAFPLAMMPRFWCSWVERAARGASAPVDHVALSLITVAASLIGVARRVAPAPSWSEPCILWTGLVGPPSSGKTPAVETSVRLLRELEGGHVAAHADALRRHARDTMQAQARWDDEALRTTRRGWVPRPRPDDAAPPAGPRRLVAGSPRIDWVARALEHAQGSVLLSRDDRAAWLDDMVRDARSAGDDSFWLSAWSGSACTVVRKARLAVNLPCAAVSVLGTIRPDAIAAALAGGDAGVAARFLFAWPTRAAFHPLSGAAVPVDRAAFDALARLRDMSGETRDLPLTPDALSRFDRFRRGHHADAGGFAGRAADWWGKGTGAVLRLAGVLTFLDWAAQAKGAAEPAHVAAGAVQSAVNLWHGYLWPHAQAVLNPGQDGGAGRHVDQVLEWLRKHRLPQVSREQIRRNALKQAVNAAGAEKIIDELVRRACLRPLDCATGRAGAPRRRWLVNPAICGQRS